jgi:hypothetical protein
MEQTRTKFVTAVGLALLLATAGAHGADAKADRVKDGDRNDEAEEIEGTWVATVTPPFGAPSFLAHPSYIHSGVFIISPDRLPPALGTPIGSGQGGLAGPRSSAISFDLRGTSLRRAGRSGGDGEGPLDRPVDLGRHPRRNGAASTLRRHARELRDAGASVGIRDHQGSAPSRRTAGLAVSRVRRAAPCHGAAPGRRRP